MVIMWDLIAKTRKAKINSMLRSCTKGIRDCTIQSDNRFFGAIEEYEPLGLKVLQRMVKIQQKLWQYYGEEQELFNETWVADDYWRQYTQECCPGMEDLIDVRDPDTMRVNPKHRKKKIQLVYWKMKTKLLDPHQGPKLMQVPRVVADRKDRNTYKNAIKLMAMNYYAMRNGSDCPSCKKRSE